MTAKGSFEVELAPLPLLQQAADSKLGRMSIDKIFEGDLVGTSQGEMLSAMTDVKGSAGYVAIERLTGKLHGKSGSFVLQHSGTMSHGEQRLTITVVPDSATGQLTGLSGSMSIRIEEGRHYYEFEYELADDASNPKS